MSGTEIRRFSGDQSHRGSQWIIALLQAFSTTLAAAFALPIIVVSVWVGSATDDLYKIALIPILAFGLWNLGSLVAGRICGNRVRQLPWAVGSAIVRAAAVAVIAYIVYHAKTDEDHLGWFFVAFGIWGFASGFNSTPLELLLRKSFESSRRAQLFSVRAFWGAIAALLAGIVIHSVFDSTLTTTRAFAYLFIAAAGCYASSAFFTLLLKEPARQHSNAKHRSSTSAFGILADRAMSRYLFFRILLAFVAMIDIYIVIYAMRELAFDRAVIGTWIIGFCLALAIGLPLSRAQATRRGGRSVLQTASWLKLIAPIILVAIPYLRDSTYLANRISDDRFWLWLLVPCFATLGASTAYLGTGNFQYLDEIAPAVERSRYIGTTNIIGIGTTCSALLGAWVITRWDFTHLFATAAAIALLCVFISGLLVDNRIVASNRITPRRTVPLSIREVRR